MTLKYIPSENVIKQASDFAVEVEATLNYSDSNQTNKQKIIDDVFIGKLGEEAVKYVCEMAGFKVSKPDYNIYYKNKKSWKHDLFIDGLGIAVKTQKYSMSKQVGLSWVFQDSPQRSDPILNKPDTLVFFVQCYDFNNYQCEVFPPKLIRELTFKEPVASHLKGKKKVVYASDIYERR